MSKEIEWIHFNSTGQEEKSCRICKLGSVNSKPINEKLQSVACENPLCYAVYHVMDTQELAEVQA